MDAAASLFATTCRTSFQLLSAINRRGHRAVVCHDPNAEGSSRHAMPVCSRYRIPFTIVRASARGRPRPRVSSGATIRLI